MLKHIQINYENGKIERYKLTDISVNDFIDYFLSQKYMLEDISEEEYESAKKFELEYNIEERFLIEIYVYKHIDKLHRNAHNRRVRSIKREKMMEMFN